MKMKTCRVCLVMDVNMFHLGNTEIKNFIESIFNLHGFDKKLDALHYACYECRAFLDKTFKFIQRALKAQQVLYDMLKVKKKICQPDLRKLDRHKLGLNTNLRKHLCIIDYNINEDTSDDRSLTNNTNSAGNCIPNSKSDTEFKESENTKPYPHSGLITKDENVLEEKKSFIEIKTEVITDPLAITSTNSLDPDDENTLTNNQSKSKLHTFDKHSCTVSKMISHDQSYTVKTTDSVNESHIVCLNNKKHDESLCNKTSNIITEAAVPDIEIMKSPEESECYVEVKIEEFPDPLASSSASADIISLESKCTEVTDDDRYSCIIKPCDTEINCDSMVYKIDSESQDENLSNIKSKRKIKSKSHTSSVTNVDDDWKPGHKSRKIKKPKSLEKQYSRAKKKPNLKTTSIPSTKSALKVIENDIIVTPRRKKVKYVFSDQSNSDEESIEKEKNKEIDDDYHPTSSGESEDSMYDKYDDEGRRLKKPDEREYPRKCDHCSFEVPVKKEHYIHYVRFHKDIEYPYALKPRYVCQFCGHISRTFQHQMTHESTHGEKVISCSMCPKKFTSTVRMKSHFRILHLGKTFECDYCGKTSKTRSDLLLHIRIHTGEKPYKCHICDAGFAHGGNRSIHIRTNHQQSIEYQKNKKRRKRKYHYTSSDTDTISEDTCITAQKRKTVKAKKKNRKKDPA